LVEENYAMRMFIIYNYQQKGKQIQDDEVSGACTALMESEKCNKFLLAGIDYLRRNVEIYLKYL
jgi:hypothetical protein